MRLPVLEATAAPSLCEASSSSQTGIVIAPTNIIPAGRNPPPATFDPTGRGDRNHLREDCQPDE